MTKDKLVVPLDMLPSIGSQEVTGTDGNPYLLRNDAMFTGYQHSCGEFSKFFIALRDECKILAHRCQKCRQLICPPFELRCPQCNFEAMQPEEMADVGRMAASPVIVFFAPARFKDQVPFGIGYVFLKNKNNKEADTALFVRVRTTQGILRPGVFNKDTEVKIVFRNERIGEMMDIFVVPQSELTAEQIAKSPLMENDISLDIPAEPYFKDPTDSDMISARQQVINRLWQLSERIKKSPRAQADLKDWKRNVRIKTAGGNFGFVIENGELRVMGLSNPDLVFAIENPTDLLPWLERGAALTNLVMEGTLWLSKPELETITRLDRLPRSLRRDNC